MANQQQFMAMANLDGRFPTARFAACAGRPPRVDGRFPTARYAVLTARCPRRYRTMDEPRRSLPDSPLRGPYGSLPWTSALPIVRYRCNYISH